MLLATRADKSPLNVSRPGETLAVAHCLLGANIELGANTRLLIGGRGGLDQLQRLAALLSHRLLLFFRNGDFVLRTRKSAIGVDVHLQQRRTNTNRIAGALIAQVVRAMHELKRFRPRTSHKQTCAPPTYMVYLVRRFLSQTPARTQGPHRKGVAQRMQTLSLKNVVASMTLFSLCGCASNESLRAKAAVAPEMACTDSELSAGVHRETSQVREWYVGCNFTYVRVHCTDAGCQRAEPKPPCLGELPCFEEHPVTLKWQLPEQTQPH